jgi:tRNA (guanine37-N1)-methyltransferase
MAFDLSSDATSWICNNLIFVCGRYEGIDQRFEQYFIDRYPEQFLKISLGKYIVYGGETPSMIVMEAITRLLPWWTHKPPLTESYYPEVGEDTIENPHYTRPVEIYGYKIPEILVSGHHKNIEKWRDDMMS